MNRRTRICLYFLLLTPLLVYWQNIFSDYGFRDDYASIREAREEPGKLVRFTGSHGRPMYGALLETSFAIADEVGRLPWIRLASVFLLTVLAVGLWQQLYHSGWSEIEAAVIGLCMALLPAAQVTSSWGIGWPQILAVLLGLAGFAAIESEVERGGLKRAIALIGGILIYALAALIYQSNALFAVVPLVAVFLVRSGREPASDIRWLLMHLGALFIGLLLAYLLTGALFAVGAFHQSTRMLLETNPFTKLGWFFWQPLPNALALFALRDDFNTGAVVFWPVALVVAALIGWGYSFEIARASSLMKRRLLYGLAATPFLAHVVSLMAAERAVGYRTLFALSGLVIVLLVFAFRSLLAAGRLKVDVYQGALALLVLAGAVTAHFNTYLLFAQPQSIEWEIVHRAAMRADFSKPRKVYIITPTKAERTTERIFADEFGSLTSDSDWASKEMFRDAVHERYPTKFPKGGSFTVDLGPTAPEDGAFDVVIDLRKLKEAREQ
jgi:hypothetical protein